MRQADWQARRWLFLCRPIGDIATAGGEEADATSCVLDGDLPTACRCPASRSRRFYVLHQGIRTLAADTIKCQQLRSWDIVRHESSLVGVL